MTLPVRKKKLLFYAHYLLIILLLPSKDARAQMPDCGSNNTYVYAINPTSILNWNVAIPLSASNPSTNTIIPPVNSWALAVSSNINSATAPSPTFYVVAQGSSPFDNKYYYYDGSNWINTGHTATYGAVNIGAGGGYIFNLNGTTGQVYRYDGTGNDVLITTITDFNSGGSAGPFDLVGDCHGNFYIVKCGSAGWLRKYNSSGTLLQQWSMTGTPATASGYGFAILGNQIYIYTDQLYAGTINASSPSLTLSTVPGTFPSVYDFGSCVGEKLPVKDTLYSCYGEAKTVTATAFAPYSYTVVSGSANVTGTGPAFSITNSGNTDAIVVLHSKGTFLTCDTGTINDTFRIVPPALANAGPDDTLAGCGSYLDTLHGSLTNTASWVNYNQSWTPAGFISLGGNTPNPIVSPFSDTTFIYTVTTDTLHGGCTWKDSVHVSLKDLTPVTDFNFTIIKGCTQDSVVFHNLTPQVINSLWQFGDGFTSTATHPQHVYTVQNSYIVKLVAGNGYCTDSVSKIIDTRHPLIASFSVDRDTICQQSTVTFTNSSTISLNPGTYYWSFGDGGTSTAANPAHLYANAGTYTAMLVVRDSLHCSDTLYRTIVVDSLPQMQFSQDVHDICTGQMVNVSATYTTSGLDGIYWDFGDNNAADNVNPTAHSYDLPGTYFIVLNGKYRVCNDVTLKDSVNVHALPLVNLGADTTLCLDGDPLYVSNLQMAQPGDHFRWNTGDTTQTMKIRHDGTYTLSVTNKYDCIASDDVVIKKDCYVDIPNSFTPNGDGSNDYFFPKQWLSSGVSDFSMKVFNRWGQIVFETTSIDGRGWDGKFNEKNQPVGVYIYDINVTLKNGREEHYTGNVTLLR